jgi:hypothetical protein
VRGEHSRAGPPLLRRGLAAAIALGALAATDDAAAQQAPRLPTQPGSAITAPTTDAPADRLLYRTTTIVRVNPIGVFNESRFGYRHRLFQSDSPLFRDNFVGFGLASIAAPPVVGLAPSFEFQPLSILQLTVSYTPLLFFGTFGYLQSSPSANAPHSDDDREQGDKDGKAYPTTGGQVTIQPLVQMKVGPIAVRSATRFIYNMTHLRHGDRVSYDPSLDLLLPRDGWAFANDSDLVFIAPKGGFTAGLRYSMARAIYSDDDFAPEEQQKTPATRTIQRLGPIVAYTFFDHPGAGFNAPTIFLLSQWWLDHPYRTGRETSQALPYVILGCFFSGDLL